MIITIVSQAGSAPLVEHVNKYPWLRNPIRYYKYDETKPPYGKGAYGNIYIGEPCDADGNPFSSNPTKVAIKIPHLPQTGVENYRSADSEERIARATKKAIQEFNFLRKRLEDFPYANPMIDIALTSNEMLTPYAISIHPFIEDRCDLDNWLYKERIVPEQILREKDVRGFQKIKSETAWSGVKTIQVWCSVALKIGRTLAQLHKRRVVHADIHPGNIFMNSTDTQAMLIDFGDSFLALPSNESRKRIVNPYLSPERILYPSSLDEKVDVYAFGILILYLATGAELELPLKPGCPGQRRHIIYSHLYSRNSKLVSGPVFEPRILDVITRATARDPVDRPDMNDLVSDLEDIAREVTTVKNDPIPLADRLIELGTKVKGLTSHSDPILMSVLDRQMTEMERLLHGLDAKPQMLDIKGARNNLLRTMVHLFDQLAEGDSWTSITTLNLWQRNALGLNGSYASATIRAIHRGAAVRRVYAVSVQQLGEKFVTNFLSQIDRHKTSPRTTIVRDKFQSALHTFNGIIPKPASLPENVRWSILRFVYILEEMKFSIEDWKLRELLYKGKKFNITGSPGLLWALCPVATISDIGTLREDNPVSLMYRAGEKEEDSRWLLVKTEALGRFQNEESLVGTSSTGKAQLVGLRLYRSVEKIPSVRKTYLEDLINTKSAIITQDIDVILQSAREAALISIEALSREEKTTLENGRRSGRFLRKANTRVSGPKT